MPVKIKIRQANTFDFVKILRLLTEAKDPPGTRIGRLDALSTSQFILAMIQGGYVAVADLGGNIVGAMALSAFRPPWSKDTVLQLENFYVQPAHRQGGVPRALMSNVLKEARRANVELRLHLCERDIAMIGGETLKTSGLRDAGRVFQLGRQDEQPELHDTGGAPERDDVDSELADKPAQPVPTRPVPELEPDGDGPPDSVEPPEGFGD